MALGDWSKRKKVSWSIGAALVAVLVGCIVAGILSDRKNKAPIIWFNNDKSPSRVG